MSWHGAWLAASRLALLGVAAHMHGSFSGRMASLRMQMSGRHRWVLCQVVILRGGRRSGGLSAALDSKHHTGVGRVIEFVYWSKACVGSQ
jgi:hypothetical protein